MGYGFRKCIMPHKCITCDKPISPDRIKAFLSNSGKLPDTCVEHSTEVAKKSVIGMAGGKTGCEPIIYDPSNKEVARQAERYANRSR